MTRRAINKAKSPEPKGPKQKIDCNKAPATSKYASAEDLPDIEVLNPVLTDDEPEMTARPPAHGKVVQNLPPSV
jgi:hypothetical protein